MLKSTATDCPTALCSDLSLLLQISLSSGRQSGGRSIGYFFWATRSGPLSASALCSTDDSSRAQRNGATRPPALPPPPPLLQRMRATSLARKALFLSGSAFEKSTVYLSGRSPSAFRKYSTDSERSVSSHIVFNPPILYVVSFSFVLQRCYSISMACLYLLSSIRSHLYLLFFLLFFLSLFCSPLPTPSSLLRCSFFSTLLRDWFRQDVLLLEGRALKNDVTPLTLVVASFEKYHVLFPFLEGLVASVCKGGLTGGKLLSFLHSQRLHGVPFVREAVERLFLSVQRAFLRQVTAWALFGVVSDRCGDFFVADSSDAASSSLVLFSAGAAEKRSDSAGGDGGGEEQTTTTERRGREDWLADGFSLRLSMIPSFVSQKSAETILFVGRAARIQTMNQVTNNGEKRSFIL